MRRPLLVIFLTLATNLIGFGIIIPLLPIYAERLGASPWMIGLIFGSYSLTQLVSSPILGALSDRIGRRPALLFSITGTVIGFVVFALGHDPWVFLLGRTIDGISGGNASVARAYISDIMPPDQRPRGFAVIGIAFGIGFVLGPALGGVFSHFGYAAPIWVAAALSTFALVLAYGWLPETVPTARTGAFRASDLARFARQSFLPLVQLRTRGALVRLLVVDFLYWTASSAYQTTLGLLTKHRFGFDVARTGYLLAGLGVVSILVQGGLVSRIVRRFGEQRTLFSGLVLLGVGLEGASLATTVWVFQAALVPAAVGAAMLMPALAALLARNGSSEEQGLVQGAATMVEGLGRTVGPVGGNLLLETVGDRSAYGAAAALLAVGSLVSALATLAPKRVAQIGPKGSPEAI